MKCPYCGHRNNLVVDTCAECKAQVDYLRDKVYLGRQFAFFEASAEQPIVVDLTPGDERRFTEPTIVSRHEYGVKFSKTPEPERRRWWRWEREWIWLPEDLPKLPFSTLALVTVVTDRKIYRPQDEVHIFVVGLTVPGAEAELEVQLSGQRVHHTRVTLSDVGLCLHRLGDLEEGEYSVIVTLPSQPTARAECSFSCAEFSLSPLIATLESHTLDRNRLSFVLRLTQLTVPYSGEVKLALRSGERVVQKQEVAAQEGRLEASFRLDWDVWESLTVEVTTPEGHTATVAFPSTSWQERQKVQLSPLDSPMWASLLPFPEAEGCVRGLHYGRGREEDTPFALPSVVAEEGRLVAQRNASLVQLLVFDPLSGAHEQFEFRDVKEGDALTFKANTPYSIFTLGAFTARGRPYEAWGVVIHPEQLQASLTAPEKAMPGDRIPIRVESHQLTQCLLLVYDVRLEHESPLPRLAQRIFHHVRDGTSYLGAERVAEVGTRNGYRGWEYADVMLTAAAPDAAPARITRLSQRTAPMMENAFASLDAVEEMAVDVEETQLSDLQSLLLTPREEFPELAHIELFAVDGATEKAVRLGEQIGTWRCRAYLFSGFDYVELTQDVQAALDLYAEMDLPAIVGDGDEVLAQVRYHAEDEATLTVTTSSDTFTHSVTGDGAVEVPLTAPGEVVAHIAVRERSDTSRRTVDPPGVETVTASRLALLQAGETVSGKRVMIFSSMGPLLQETIEALIHYPFG